MVDELVEKLAIVRLFRDDEDFSEEKL